MIDIILEIVSVLISLAFLVTSFGGGDRVRPKNLNQENYINPDEHIEDRVNAFRKKESDKNLKKAAPKTTFDKNSRMIYRYSIVDEWFSVVVLMVGIICCLYAAYCFDSLGEMYLGGLYLIFGCVSMLMGIRDIEAYKAAKTVINNYQ